MSELKRAERLALLDALTAYRLQYNGHEGYAKVRALGRADSVLPAVHRTQGAVFAPI